MGTVLCLAGFTCQQTGIRSVTAHQKFAVLVMEQELFGEMTRLNREVIFRGFHPCDGPDTIVVDGEKVKGRWVEGYLYVTHTGEYEIGGYCEEYNIERYTYNVLPSTVGQYTDLTDRTGKRIFEGDILKIAKCSDGLGAYYSPPLEYPVNVMVKWDLCAWMWETLGGEKYYLGFPDAWCHYECEVIGTVFDEEAHQ